MDPSKPAYYRSQPVNAVTLATGSRVLRGIVIENIDYSDVDAVGYVEKRAASDGMHASDVYLSGRNVVIRGTIYSTSLAELFDFLHFLRAVFSPTSAYQESPPDRGFLPFQFSEPTQDEASFPGGVKKLVMYLRPRKNLQFNIDRDRIASTLADLTKQQPGALPWTIQLWAKDPRIYVDPDKTIGINGGPITAVTSQAVNRGDYESPLNVLIAKAAATAGTVHITGLNNVDMTITLLAEANRIYRWYGDDRVLMVQDSSAGPNAPEALRMDLVSFATRNHKPMVPAAINPPTKPFHTDVTVTTTVALDTGSRLFWSEAFA